MASRAYALYRPEVGNNSQLLPKIWPKKGPKILQKWSNLPNLVDNPLKIFIIKSKTHF
jgi:hypothetical protein